MPTLDDLFPPAELDAALVAGHVHRSRHPDLPLSMYTYTRSCQYAQAWTFVTTRCRGLVVDDTTGEILAFPLPKFFNAEEHGHGRPYAPPLPDEPYEVWEKLDGSLGIVFHHADRWHAATKSSFTSPQAAWAQSWLDTHDTSRLVPGTTYLAEIIHPENRIVVDYRGRRDLVLLAAHDPRGIELPLGLVADDWDPIGRIVKGWPPVSLDYLLAATGSSTRIDDGRPLAGTDAEGFVIRFASGLRVKAKNADYVRLHRIITGVNERDIWHCLGLRQFAGRPVKDVAKALSCPVGEVTAVADSGRDPLDTLLKAVPDEFDTWIRDTATRLRKAAADLEQAIAGTFTRLAHLADDRKAFAHTLRGTVADPVIRAGIFLRLDGRPTDLHAWHHIKPEPGRPFRDDEEA